MRFIRLAIALLALSLLIGCSTANPSDTGYRSDVTPDCDGSNWR